MASSEDSSSYGADAIEYYHAAAGEAILQGLQNLDDPAALETIIGRAKDNRTSNFVLDFSDSAGWICHDVPPLSVAGLLETERPHFLSTRWINIWHPATQKHLLELLAKHYDFSPRLLATMCSDPKPTEASQDSVRHANLHRRLWQRQSRRLTPEWIGGKGIDELSELSSISSHSSASSLDLYRIVNDLWHYSSVDLGRNYVCIGYNSLYGTKIGGEAPGEGLLPHCTRVWTWLLLCEDNTIVSIQEDPFPNSTGRMTNLEHRIFNETRRNTLNVLSSLAGSGPSAQPTTTPMAQLDLRTRLGSTPSESAHRLTDVAGLLFYYLFENWQNSYTLIIRRESRYGVELNHIRTQMLQSPQLCHIDRLDSIGKELGVLKRHYATYNRIIDRLLEPQTATVASVQGTPIARATSQSSLDTVRAIVAEKKSMLGVSLGSAARVRFQRLRDLIDLYALSEVEEYIKQKDALVAMNFQLIAIKESLDVERLTKVTLLLTKATFMFLPCSLLIAYFSAQLRGVEYTITEFWVSFAVVLFVSAVVVFIFGLFSGTTQTKAVIRTFWEGMNGVGRRTLDQC